MSNELNHLVPNSASKEITPAQGVFEGMEREVGGIGMGVLKDGTPYLNQRGLAALCGVQNAHIGTISSQWNERIKSPESHRSRQYSPKRERHHQQPISN